MKYRKKYRFYVIDENNYVRSAIWRIVFSNNSLYVFPGKMGRYFKLSMHPKEESSARDYQMGLKNNYSMELSQNGYETPKPVRWSCPPLNNNEIKCIASIIIPTEFLRPPKSILSTYNGSENFKILMAKPGNAIDVDIFCSEINPILVEKEITDKGMELMVKDFLSQKECIFVAYKQINFDAQKVYKIKDQKGKHYPLSDVMENETTISNLCGVLHSEPSTKRAIQFCDVYGLSLKKDVKKLTEK